MTVTASQPPFVLHYIFDPLCGWCYAAAPLVQAARHVPGVSLQWHGGGMLTGSHVRTITADWRGYVMPHDQRIAELTGQPFGTAYFDGLLNNLGAVLDSEPPTTALLAAEQVAQRGLDMLARQQQAHYVQGRRISDPQVLLSLAEDMGLDRQAFSSAFQHLSGTATHQHIAQARQWLQLAQGQGFPTFALEFDHPEPEQPGQRAVQRIDIGPWLGDVQGWVQQLGEWVTQVAALRDSTAAAAQAHGCADGSCSLP
ncbi:DsbA family protein [Delftia sp. PS-11]|uniref:DsbA family protein n=1 Tax=Delftia sp. PS-11 TaxID=2767222 RepID=UPI0024582B65|nr:DsbA family protein [Delftia sp. PS-11]KAJ8743302.1 DsbA family protein [Delftia sp. PS-11]